MTTAAAVVAWLRAEVGYTECPHRAGSCEFAGHGAPFDKNHVKYATMLGLANGVFWCDYLANAAYSENGVAVPPGVKSASTRASAAGWKQAGLWVSAADIRQGDHVIMCVEGRNGRGVPDHTGVCVGPWDHGHLPTIDGNTSPTAHGSQGNGGGVYPKQRPAAVVLGAGRPAYSNPQPQPQPEDEDMLIVFADHTHADPSQVLQLDGRLYVIDEGATAAAIAGGGYKTLEIGATDYAQMKAKAEA